MTWVEDVLSEQQERHRVTESLRLDREVARDMNIANTQRDLTPFGTLPV